MFFWFAVAINKQKSCLSDLLFAVLVVTHLHKSINAGSIFRRSFNFLFRKVFIEDIYKRLLPEKYETSVSEVDLD